MKLSVVAALALASSAAAFAPPAGPGAAATTALAAESDRRAFAAPAGAALLAAVPTVARAGTMQQERVSIPTEQ